MFTTQDVRCLYYEQKEKLENGVEILEHIEFDLINKNVVCWTKVDREFSVVPLSFEELQAINKKCKKLRMDIEETIEKMIKNYKEADKCGLSNNDFKKGGRVNDNSESRKN